MSYKYVSHITAITILLLILFVTNKVSKDVFLLLYAPLCIAMLIFGILEFKNTLKDKENIDSENKRQLNNRMKTK